jgi:hypothetical protein
MLLRQSACELDGVVWNGKNLRELIISSWKFNKVDSGNHFEASKSKSTSLASNLHFPRTNSFKRARFLEKSLSFPTKTLPSTAV